MNKKVFNASHPVWVRGLKHNAQYLNVSLIESHPVWVRGLKRHQMAPPSMAAGVAPRVGAWIETLRPLVRWLVIMSHPVWVRGLKLVKLAVVLHHLWSHPVWVRGLKP